MGRRSTALIALVLALAACAHDQPHPSRTWLRYRVAAGDTLGAIATRYHSSVEELVRLNRLADPNRIEVGQELVLPVRTMASGRTGSESGLAWPVAAAVSSPFGRRDGRPHDGIDLVVPDGTEVHAAADGRVVYSGHQLAGYGNLVILRHDDHLLTVYAHNSRLLVSEGATVHRGEVISISGHSGRSTGPHLHFEVRRDGVPCDPMGYLPR